MKTIVVTIRGKVCKLLGWLLWQVSGVDTLQVYAWHDTYPDGDELLMQFSLFAECPRCGKPTVENPQKEPYCTECAEWLREWVAMYDDDRPVESLDEVLGPPRQ